MPSLSDSTDSDNITSTDGAQGSLVPTLFLDDPCMLVRQAYSPIAPDTESELLEALSETEEPQPISPTSAPPSPDYTPATPHTDGESESYETSETRVTSPHSFTPSEIPLHYHLLKGHHLPDIT
ncbi:hypothetical protein Tco_0892445 [Tanacetum coccineum]|uniref:Uncharacterized protein n=1 Tax=Tanacetum coccineum TaxID=301880 RepID=A0ABQ5C7A2_9ASTR